MRRTRTDATGARQRQALIGDATTEIRQAKSEGGPRRRASTNTDFVGPARSDGSPMRNTLSLAAATVLKGVTEAVVPTPTTTRGRRRQEAQPSIFELADAAANHVLEGNPGEDSLLQTCCTRVCDTSGARHEKIFTEYSAGEDLERFGLPGLAELGYVLLDDDALTRDDLRIRKILGLRVAVQRRLAVERFCYIIEKSDLPMDISKHEVKSTATKLTELDHVNILRCFGVAEDDDNIYFLYEKMQCRTLQHAIESKRHVKWTLEQKMNLGRGVCAALAHAWNKANLQHLTLNLSSVLLPCDENDSVEFPKVFGIGLCGVFRSEDGDNPIWAPELRTLAIVAKQQRRKNFIGHTTPVERIKWDSWALGTLMYATIEGHLPYTKCEIQDMEIAPKFTEADKEAQNMIELLLYVNPNRRSTATQALKDKSFRKYWRFGTQEIAEAMCKVEAFCQCSLAKRMFGRFLVHFMDDRCMRRVAHTFYILDVDGDGVVSAMDLQAAARLAELPKEVPDIICSCLGENGAISIWGFADSLAEETIDSRALRLAFESIDEDGSEQITPPELFEALSPLSSELTLEQVVHHIAEVEGLAEDADDSAQDHVLDFAEFAQLFPERTRLMKELQARATQAAEASNELQDRFSSVQGDVKEWISKMEGVKQQMNHLKGLVLERFRGEEKRHEALDNLKTQLKLADSSFRHVPAPSGEVTHMRTSTVAKTKSVRRRSVNNHKNEILLGFDTFCKDHASDESWGALLTKETKALASTASKKGKARLNEPDYLASYFAVETAVEKLTDALTWTKGQFEEYESFCDAFSHLEAPLPAVSRATRGLKERTNEPEELVSPSARAAAAAVAISGNPLSCLCGGGSLRLATSMRQVPL